MAKNKILIADNETTVSVFLKKIVEFDKSNNAEVDIANDTKTFNTLLSKNLYSLIIIDLSFENQKVTDFISKFSSENPFTQIIAISASIDVNIAMLAIRSGSYDFISKPFSSETIMLVVKNALEKRQLLMEKEELNKDLTYVNDQFSDANKLITQQNDQLDNYLKNMISALDKMKSISIETGRVKSFETNLKIISEKINEIYKPVSFVFMLYEKKTKKLNVKMEKNNSSSFPIGTQIDYSVFKKYFGSKGVSVEASLSNNKDLTAIILPLETGKMILGLIIMDINKSEYEEGMEVFYEILRYMLTISMLNSRFLEDSRRSYLESLVAFLLLEEKIHKGIKKHSETVASICVKVAKSMKLSELEIRNLQYAGLLHLIGLIKIPKSEMTAANYFNKESGIEIKNAILEGSQILTPLVFMEDAKIIIEELFENYDGSGIPSGKKSHKIMLPSRILRIVGDFLAFKNMFKMNNSDIINYMEKNTGKEYDPEILKIFFDLIIKH
ncbi:response regulator [candidate division WOR-3 bacterium]|nr:response regulator [candidate division WOR-3 bacterium]